TTPPPPAGAAGARCSPARAPRRDIRPAPHARPAATAAPPACPAGSRSPAPATPARSWPRARPWLSSRLHQRVVDPRPVLALVFLRPLGGLDHEHHEDVVLRVDPELGPADPPPAERPVARPLQLVVG